MSPADHASLAELSRLASELERDREAMSRCSDDARATLAAIEAGTDDRSARIVGAVALHAWYTGLETALERAARVIDRSVPSGPASHRDLLSQSMSDLPSLRPRILDRALESDLLSLLSFRHFFRHAYGVELDRDKLRVELERLVRIEPAVAAALDAWRAHLDAAIDVLAES